MYKASGITFAERYGDRWPGDVPEDLTYDCGPPSIGSDPPSDKESILSGDEELALAQEAAEASKAAGCESTDGDAANDEAADGKEVDEEAAADEEAKGTGEARCARMFLAYRSASIEVTLYQGKKFR
jgi:hypothetical protein